MSSSRGPLGVAAAGGRAMSALWLTILWSAVVTPTALGASGLRFREVATSWGLSFRHHHGGSGERYMVETVVGGVVLFDFDDDGDDDVLFVDGGALPGYAGEAARTVLYRNEGAGRFIDVTRRAGIDHQGYLAGGTAGDIEGDGDLDLYLTAFGTNRMLRNQGNGTFQEVGGESGTADPAWSSSAAFADPDRDGDLDLYVTNYVDFTLANHKFCGDEAAGLQGYCGPYAYEGVPDRYYRNRGDGTFEDATVACGLSGPAEAGLGVVFGDLNNDRWPDIYVANDADPNFLFFNRGDGSFEDVSLLSGTAYSATGSAEGGMGVDLGDVDGNGLLDILVTNFELESNALYLNHGDGIFQDSRYPLQLAESSYLSLAFGVALADFDQDGDLDIAAANGHILDNAAQFIAGSRYAQRNQVFELLQGRYREELDSGFEAVRVSRGLAAGDLDGDGDLDLVIVNSNDVAEVYENIGAQGGWLQVDLRQSEGNRFAIGGRVVVAGAGDSAEQMREVVTGSSYLSQDSLTLHFGLGESRAAVDRIEIVWPSSRQQRILDVPAGRRLRVFSLF